MIIEYGPMTIEQGQKPIHVQNNWIPKRTTLEIEDLLTTFDISLKINMHKFLYLSFY